VLFVILFDDYVPIQKKRL